MTRQTTYKIFKMQKMVHSRVFLCIELHVRLTLDRALTSEENACWKFVKYAGTIAQENL